MDLNVQSQWLSMASKGEVIHLRHLVFLGGWKGVRLNPREGF